MFDSLSSRLEGIVKRLRGKGRLTEADVDEMLKEIRTALLEADVNVGVVRNVTARIREQAVGSQVSEALDPSQQIVKIVNAELTAMLGGETLKIQFASRPPTVVLMAGLQGSGKTTNSAKLARWFKAQGRQPLLVGADLQRPAAVEQPLHGLLVVDVERRRLGARVVRSAVRSTCRCSANPAIRWPRPAAASRRPVVWARTSSSSTPPVAWPSTWR
jgi:signal recognition particle GTPase